MLTTVLTQLIDRVGEDGTVSPGLFNDQAAQILEPGSFDHANKENRWRFFLASDSALAVAFWDKFEQAKAAKAINLELRSRIVLAAGEVLPVSIFDGASKGLGRISASCTSGLWKSAMSSGLGTSGSGPPPSPSLTPADGSLREHERPVFEVSLQRLACPQHLFNADTMEYNNGAALRCTDSGTEGSRWQAHSVGLA
jgi:hypothetical protein